MTCAIASALLGGKQTFAVDASGHGCTYESGRSKCGRVPIGVASPDIYKLAIDVLIGDAPVPYVDCISRFFNTGSTRIDGRDIMNVFWMCARHDQRYAI